MKYFLCSKGKEIGQARQGSGRTVNPRAVGPVTLLRPPDQEKEWQSQLAESQRALDVQKRASHSPTNSQFHRDTQEGSRHVWWLPICPRSLRTGVYAGVPGLGMCGTSSSLYTVSTGSRERQQSLHESKEHLSKIRALIIKNISVSITSHHKQCKMLTAGEQPVRYLEICVSLHSFPVHLRLF